MKKFFNLILAGFSLGVIAISCKKDASVGMMTQTSRNVRFQLYTNQDFSGNNSIISFSIFIRNSRDDIFDSALAPMPIKDIPDAAHKLIIEKEIPGNDQADLAVGFRYTIQNVGNSWFTDTIKAGNVFKVIDYAFQ